MKKNKPEDLKKLFEEMQAEVWAKHNLSDIYLRKIIEITCGISETCESRNEDGTEQWKGFKCLRNGLRDLIK